MKQLQYFFYKVLQRLNLGGVNNFFRKNGMTIGDNCHIYSNILPAEPFLVAIGDNVTISSDVVFVTHDNSIIKVNPSWPNVFGFINIGNNCFIGQRATIMYGVTLADNIIVASGSVVTNSFDEERIIIAGNPARKIGSWDSMELKMKPYVMSRYVVKEKAITNPELFIKRKSK